MSLAKRLAPVAEGINAPGAPEQTRSQRLAERLSGLDFSAPAGPAPPNRRSLSERLSGLSSLTPPEEASRASPRRLSERLSGLDLSAPTPSPPESVPLSRRLQGVDFSPPSIQEPERESLPERMGRIGGLLSQLSPQTFPVEFGPWAPDLPAYLHRGATVANGVYPSANSYRPVKALTAATAALDARARGAIAARDTAGNNFNYAGDAAKLYEVRSSGVTDKSKAGGYSTTADEVWEFALFGDTVIATNYDDDVQGLTAGGAGLFADHITSTNVPKARHVTVVGDFLVLGNTNDTTDGVKPNRVWWSAINDSQDFDPDATTQCDFQDLADGGWVQQIVGGPGYALIFQQTLIRRMVYDGPPTIFRFDQIVDRSRGTSIPNSVVNFGRLVFFIAEDGFYVNDGLSSQPIGANMVDRTFNSLFDTANAHLVSGAVDPVNKVVAWAFPTGGSTFANKVYFYEWVNRRWSEADIDMDMLAQTTGEALTLEDLDSVALDSSADTTLSANEASGQTVISVTDETGFAVGDTVRITLNDSTVHQTTVGSIAVGEITIDDALPSAADSGNRFVKTSLDALTPSLDSAQWQGGGIRFGAFDTAHKLSYFDGSTLAATIETGDLELFPGRMARVQGLRPLIDGGTITTQIASRPTLQDMVSFAAAESLDSIGETDHLVESRYHRIRCSIAAGGSWTHAQGVQVEAIPMGKR